MTPDSIPVTPVSTLECRSCGAGAHLPDPLCRPCGRLLALGRHGAYFTFFGLTRRLTIAQDDLERRFRELSRKFHPDYYYNASPAERLASLERSSYLNDAYRALRTPATRIEHLLAIEGLPPTKSEGMESGGAKVPPALLEEVFELNEQLDAIREQRESGGDPAALAAQLDAARAPIERKREEHEQHIAALSAKWDGIDETGTPAERRATLEALREQLLE